MSRVSEVTSQSVARVLEECRMTQLTQSIKIDQERVKEMAKHIAQINQMKPSTPGKGENVDLTI
jgi:hypothetical protein